MKDPFEFMRQAIQEARKGNTPFGCVIVQNDRIVARAYNTVAPDGDVTAHAELQAIRQLKQPGKASDLTGYTLYTTCEPCPMCMSAYVFAGISTVFFGASIPLVKKFTAQIDISSGEVAARSNRNVLIIPGLLAEECIALFEEFPVPSAKN